MGSDTESVHDAVNEASDKADIVLTIDSITKEFGDLRAVDVPELSLVDGEFFTLLGPSGSGKSTLLRMIAGLESPTTGRVFLEGQDVTDVPANDRSVALIFQNFQLFPHKTVGENVGFPLKMDGVPTQERRERVKEMLAFVDLEGYIDRYPKQLSGGEQQRVALTRGMIAEPDVLLLDEPLASLDRNLRHQLEVELRKYQRRLGITFVYVTHNQEEALTMSDRIAVMNDAEIEQIGEPMDVYNTPQSAFVAQFLGEVNTIEGTVDATETGQAGLSHNGMHLPGRVVDDVPVGAPAEMCIKSENLAIVTDERTEHTIQGTLRDSIFTGKTVDYLVEPHDLDIEDDELIVNMTKRDRKRIDTGDTVTVTWEPTEAPVFRK